MLPPCRASNRNIGVSTPLGYTPETRTPEPASSADNAVRNARKPDLAAEYVADPGSEMMPPIETVASNRPRPRARIPGTAAFMSWIGQDSMTSTWVESTSGSKVPTGPGTIRPALQTSTSSRSAHSPRMRLASPSTAARSRTSQATPMVSSPITIDRPSRGASSMSTAMMRYPLLRNITATPPPIAPAAPVTIASRSDIRVRHPDGVEATGFQLGPAHQPGDPAQILL